MGCSESIHNDTTNPVEVWFQLKGGKCPIGGCMKKALQPGKTTGNKYLQLNLGHEVCVESVQTKAQTQCKDVISPGFAGQHAIYNVAEILDHRFPTPEIPGPAEIPDVIPPIPDEDAHYSNFDLLLYIIPLVLALGLIVIVKKICNAIKKRSTTSVTFSISYDTKFGEEVKVVGNTSALGHWDPNRAAVLKWTDKNQNNLWSKTVEVKFPPANEPLQYKYIVVSSDGQVKEWEPCENHILNHKYGYEHVCRDGWGKCDVRSSEHSSALMGA